jgi:hypothetical protein
MFTSVEAKSFFGISIKAVRGQNFRPMDFPAHKSRAKSQSITGRSNASSIDDFSHRPQVKNRFIWSYEAACRFRGLYSIMKGVFANSMAVITRRIVADERHMY